MALELDDILEMDEDELLEYIIRESIERGIVFDLDMLDCNGKIALYDFIADNLNPEFQAELHSECQLELGCSMFPNAENQDDLDEEMEHDFSRD